MSKQPLPIDLAELERIAEYAPTTKEMACHFHVSMPTITRRLRLRGYREAYERGLSKRHMGLRRAQYEKAMSGNVAMLIWLGKQELGQRETVFENITSQEADGENIRELLAQRIHRIAARMKAAGVQIPEPEAVGQIQQRLEEMRDAERVEQAGKNGH